MSTAYELLGIGTNATREELEAAYQRQRAAYDPARVVGMGAELEQLAAQRRQELTLAYQTLRPALAAPPRLSEEDERRRDKQTIWALLAFVAIAIAVILLQNVAVPLRSVVPEGIDTTSQTSKPAPDFALPSVDGQQIALSDYKGQVVLINIWATWCPPCVRETPRLARVYDQFKDQGFVILGVNTTDQDDKARVATFVQDQKINYPILYDTEGVVGLAYSSRLMPTSYLIDRQGNIVEIKVGEVDEAQLRERVAALLQEEAPLASE